MSETCLYKLLSRLGFVFLYDMFTLCSSLNFPFLSYAAGEDRSPRDETKFGQHLATKLLFISAP